MAARGHVRQQVGCVCVVEGGGQQGGGDLGQGVIVVSSDESAPEPVLVAERFTAPVLLGLDEGGVVNEEFRTAV